MSYHTRPVPSSRKECEISAYWWTDQLRKSNPPLESDQISRFQKHLTEILENKYEGHWYPQDPERGSAFRSLMCEHSVIDPVLEIAAKRAGITKLRQRLPLDLLMWIDPFSVKVQFAHSTKKTVIYEEPEDTMNQFLRSYQRSSSIGMSSNVTSINQLPFDNSYVFIASKQ